MTINLSEFTHMLRNNIRLYENKIKFVNFVNFVIFEN